MALSLQDAAKLSTTDLQRGVIETFILESPVLDRIPFLTINGNAYAYNEEATLPGVAFRGVNETYTDSTGTVNQRSESLVILGGYADVDRFIALTRSNLNDQRAVQTRMKVKAASYKFQDTFINGDTAVDPKSFDGLRKRLTGKQVISAGLPIVGNGNADSFAFFDKLDELVAAVPGLNGSNGALYTNRAVQAKILSAGRRIGGVEVVREDIGGKRAVMWNGIPILDIGQTPEGTDIILLSSGSDDGDGSSAPTTDIYAVRFGEDEGDRAVTGLTNGGVHVEDLGLLTDRPVYRTFIEFFCGLAMFGGQGAARLTDVQVA